MWDWSDLPLLLRLLKVNDIYCGIKKLNSWNFCVIFFSEFIASIHLQIMLQSMIKRTVYSICEFCIFLNKNKRHPLENEKMNGQRNEWKAEGLLWRGWAS